MVMDHQPHGVQELVKSPKSCETSEYSFLSSIKYQSQHSSEQPKSRIGLTQSYRRSNSEEEEKRPPIRESVLTTHQMPGQLSAHGFMKPSLWWYCADHILQGGPLQAHTVFCLLDCLQQRWCKPGGLLFHLWTRTHLPFLHIPLFPPHIVTEERTPTLEPTKTNRWFIIFYFAVSIFITAKIHGAGKKKNYLETELEILRCVIFLLFITEETLYLTLSTQHRKEQRGEFGTYASAPGPFHSSPRKDWQCETSITFLKCCSSTSHFTLWLNVIFWSFVLQKAILRAGLNYSLSRAKGIFLTIALACPSHQDIRSQKIPEAYRITSSTWPLIHYNCGAGRNITFSNLLPGENGHSQDRNSLRWHG